MKDMVMDWTVDELARLRASDDLHIAPFRDDGITPGTPTWIWSVVVDNALYVRAYHGTDSRWYRSARKQRAGKVTAAGMRRAVALEPIDGPVNDRIDDAYRTKYASSSYLGAMISARARAATIRIVPVDAERP